MIRKVDPLICPRCGGTQKVIAFLTDYPAVDRIIDHLELVFVAAKRPPPRISADKFLAAETSGKYFL